MLFNSQIFVFVFLPVMLIGYYGLHKLKIHKGAKILLLLGSLYFYAYYNLRYTVLLVCGIFGNYLLYRILMALRSDDQKQQVMRKVIAILGVSANLLLIFYYKYFNFFITNVNRVFATNVGLRDIILPLGISFFTFQQISFIVDSYRKETGQYSLLDYGVFISFFPQLVAGPIVLHQEMIPQLGREERWHLDVERMAVGLRYFVIGLFKKTMIADRFGNVVTLGYTNLVGWNTWEAAFIILSYTLQIYFDFSGYSDMAIGLGKIFGLDIPVNFNSPYKAVTIADFWKRWHMTMTNFFTKYVYIPLGGSRKGKIRTYVNILIVFSLSGLWHGAAWSFVLWGMMHGAALVFHRIFKRYIEKLPQVVTGFSTFVFVNIAGVLFRADSVWQARQMIRYLFSGNITGGSLDLCYAFLGGNLQLMFENMPYNTVLFDGIACAVTILGIAAGLILVFMGASSHQIANNRKIYRSEGIIWGIMFVLSIMTFTNVSTFLYFDF